jgi:hypothetical protein
MKQTITLRYCQRFLFLFRLLLINIHQQIKKCQSGEDLLLFCIDTTLMDTTLGSRVVQRSKALHLSARGITIDSGSIPGCITTGCVWESHREAHNWPSIVRVWPG